MEKNWGDENCKEKRSRNGVGMIREVRKIKRESILFVEVLGILPIIIEIKVISRKTEKQRLGDQKIGL